jgi:hypothetical protein
VHAAASAFIVTWSPTLDKWDSQEAGYDEAIQVTVGGQL